jgi:hypothetical protein
MQVDRVRRGTSYVAIYFDALLEQLNSTFATMSINEESVGSVGGAGRCARWLAPTASIAVVAVFPKGAGNIGSCSSFPAVTVGSERTPHEQATPHYLS